MSDNLDLSASITTEEPEVAADLDQLRYLVFQGKKGDTGDSAYEEAVELGFVGTEAEWIASLKGEKGDTGYSPEIRVTDITGGHKVDVYNELGFESFDVMDGIDGTDGEDGEDGTDGVSPTVTVQNIAGGHSVTITDATHPQGQSFAVMNGSGIPEDVKVALLDCFENVAWINDQGQTYYDALYAALYPPKTLVSISAVFTQGSAVIYDTDSLDTLKQYLTVTATYDDTSTGVVTNYTLSGTLTVGTSTITVSYGGKTTTFTVTVTHRDVIPAEYQKVEYIENTGTAYIWTQLQMQLGYKVKAKAYRASKPNGTQVVVGGKVGNKTYSFLAYSASSENRLGSFCGNTINAFTNLSGLYNGFVEAETVFRESQISVTLKNSTATETVSANGSPQVSSLALFSTGNMQETLYFIGRIASVSVEDGNGNAVGNLVPCYRKSDSVVGMYDTANGVFYTSSSSDVFSKGGDAA